jgi:hypothetical protein
MPIYPPNDEWCESIVSYDGYWTVVSSPAGTSVVLDSDRTVGNYSIAIPGFIPGYDISAVSLYFNFIPGTSFDFSKVHEFDFYIKIGEVIDDYWGCGWKPWLEIYFIKDENNYAKKRIPFEKALQNLWVPVVLSTGPEAPDWEIVGNFDWKGVTKIRFYVERDISPLPPVVGTRFIKVDGILFYIKEEFSQVTVKSEPILGVRVRINGAEPMLLGYTPVTRWITPSVRTLIVDEIYGGYTFKRWDDGSTSPSRTVDLSVPRAYEFTAYYEAPAPPPPTTVSVWRPGYLIQYLIRLIQTIFKRR